MKYRKILILFYLVFISVNLSGQSISDLSLKICDSIESYHYIESDTVEFKQTEIYFKLLKEYMLSQKKLERKSFQRNFNVLNYKLTRELNKTCNSFRVKYTPPLPLSNLLEIDSIFSDEQSEKINKRTKQIRNKNQLEIVILSIDDLYPENDINEFANKKLVDWNIGKNFEKSGIITVFSKKLRQIRISTTFTSKKYLTDENCEKIISEIIIPNFKKDNYFDGIYKSLMEIKKIIK